MSYPSPSVHTDYDPSSRCHDAVLQQHRTANPSPRFCGSDALGSSFFNGYSNGYNSATKDCPKSMIAAGSELPWFPVSYNTVCSMDQDAYAEDQDVHNQQTTYKDGAEYQHGGQHGHYEYSSSPEVEDYGHRGEMVASPIDESQYCAFSTTESQCEQPPSYPHQWVQDVRMSSQGSTEVPDEYRACIARRSDEVHASGLHGLESDNDVVHVYGSGGNYLPYKRDEEVPHQPVRYQPLDEWNLQVASEAYDSLVDNWNQLSDPTSTKDNVKSEPLPMSPVTVPSQQHIADSFRRLKRSWSPELCQLAPAPLMNHLPPPPFPESHELLCGTSSKYSLIGSTSPSPSSRHGLEHRTARSASPRHQEQKPDISGSAYPGSTQSILKLSNAKKVSEKKQALACLFCRERKIACGRPDPDSEDQTCNQCARRNITCEYPKESRRGQHKRTRRKTTHNHDVNRSSPSSAN